MSLVRLPVCHDARFETAAATKASGSRSNVSTLGTSPGRQQAMAEAGIHMPPAAISGRSEPSTFLIALTVGFW